MDRIYAMSDIHRYYDLIEKNLGKNRFRKQINILWRLYYIGYGPESSKVLYKIKKLMRNYPDQVTALKVNHETMFLEFIEAREHDIWNIECLAGDKDFSTINTFISEETKDKTNKIKLEHNNPIELGFKIAKLIKDDIKTNYKELINWLKNLPLYYEIDKQIFVHGGIDEEAGDWWQYGTSEEIFVGKYPAIFGKFYKNIIAGHVGTNSLVSVQ